MTLRLNVFGPVQKKGSSLDKIFLGVHDSMWLQKNMSFTACCWKSWRINENQIEFWGCIYLQVSWVPIASPSQYSPFHPRILMAEPHCLGMTGMNFQASNKPI